MPNLVFVARPCLQTFGKTQTGVFPISGQSFIKRNCHNASDDIDMKPGSATKLNKRNKASKKFDDDFMPENCDTIAIFPITTNLEQSGSQILDA